MLTSGMLVRRLAVILLGVMIAMTVYFTVYNNQQADALSASQWEYVRSAVQGFFAGQAQYSSDGEAGFLIERTALKSRLDSNGNWDLSAASAPTQVLGEGDDAANAPVLVDNLISTPNVIPGTSVRCNWSGGYGSATAPNCFDANKVNQIAARVNAHEQAGFSTDIVVYCASGRTESATVGGLGPLAQTGALGGSSTPKVLGFKWGRNGWTATSTTTTATTGTTGSPPAPGVHALATNAGPCNSKGVNADAVRCSAQWALYSTTGGDPDWGGTYYNMGNGVTALTTSNQLIDVRTPSPASTMAPASTPNTMKIPIEHLFDNPGQLNFLAARTTATKNVFIGRTMHVPLMASTSSVMLGYNSTAYVWGVNSYNTSLSGESWQTGNWNGSATAPTAYSTIAASANVDTSGVDRTAPSQSAIGASGITANSAVISRTASEPATMKVEYGTSPGVYTNTVNNTVLNASKSVTLGALSENTTYYYRVTSYDGQAWRAGPSAEMSFTTPDVTKPVISNIQPTGTITTGSTTLSADYSDIGGSGINPSTAMIHLDGPSLPGCTATATGITCSKSGLTIGTHNILVMVTDNAGNYSELSSQFTVADATAPTVSNILPSGSITTDSATVSASFADAAPSSGINPATASLTVSGATVSGCSASASGISCTASGMGVGSHTIDVAVSDNAGNPGSGSGSFTVDDAAAPSVSYGGPSGTISDSGPTVTGSATDGSPTSGLASASLSLNGGAASACTIDGSGNVSCPTSGLADGDYNAEIVVTDGAGNPGTATGSFTVSTVVPCTPAKPILGLSKGTANWATMTDYLARQLSVPVKLSNKGTDTAYSAAITGATATNGVSLASSTPMGLGDIAGGGNASATLKYFVPLGTNSFKTTISASAADACGTGYTYP